MQSFPQKLAHFCAYDIALIVVQIFLPRLILGSRAMASTAALPPKADSDGLLKTKPTVKTPYLK